MFISDIPVHRIVATAFHGEHPPDKSFVDHFDRNRQNNRPENLSWVSPLENALLNPNTLKAILDSYGSLENFFDNPKQPKSGKTDTNLGWMRPGTKDEMENIRRNMSEWVKKGRIPSGGEIGEWIFKSTPKQHIQRPKPDDLIESLTPGAVQKNWTAQSEFPACPQEVFNDPIAEYAEQIEDDELFFQTTYYYTTVIQRTIIDNGEALLVMYEVFNKDRDNKRWGIMRITFENEKFIHEIIPNYNDTLEHYW